MKRTQSTQPGARNRKRWIRPAIASGAGGTALVVWFEELLALAAEFLGVIVLPILAGIIYLFNHSVLLKPFANKWLNLAVLWEIGLLVLIIYVPFLQGPFGTYPLSLTDWALILALAITIVPVLELAKWLGRRGWFGPIE
jgi:Ca2+-transporting ATPase